jgi:putative transposase
VKKRLEQIIDEIVHEDQWPLIELAIQPDHVHLFVRTLPSPLPSAIPRLIKGRSSRLLRQEFAHLQRMPVLWSPSSFLSTAGHVSSETIARYLQQQSEHEEVPASTPAPDKERPFIPVLERTGLSGPFSVKTLKEMEHLAVPPHTSSHTTPVSPDTQKVLQKRRKLASDAIDENTKSLHNSCNSIRRSY